MARKGLEPGDQIEWNSLTAGIAMQRDDEGASGVGRRATTHPVL